MINQININQANVTPLFEEPAAVLRPNDTGINDPNKANERKLFVGMLSKTHTEEEIRAMFRPFGEIEECTVLRTSEGQSRGCAFIKFTTHKSAIDAINRLHASTTMEGASSSLVVKFADNDKERAVRKMQQLVSNNVLTQNTGAVPATLNYQLPANIIQFSNTPASINPQVQSENKNTEEAFQESVEHNIYKDPNYLAQIYNQAHQGLVPLVNGAPMYGEVANIYQNGINAQIMQELQHGYPMYPFNMQSGIYQYALPQQGNYPQETSPRATQQQQQRPIIANGLSPVNLAAAGSSSPIAVPTSCLTTAGYTPAGPGLPFAIVSIPIPGQGIVAVPVSPSGSANQMLHINPCAPQKEGPDECNLFIYHLPAEFTDQDLANIFIPFGTVISAKVFIDRATNQSKCFGFVSYDNVTSAQLAIHTMNGFNIGNKRLKVQLKRAKPEDAQLAQIDVMASC